MQESRGSPGCHCRGNNKHWGDTSKSGGGNGHGSDKWKVKGGLETRAKQVGVRVSKEQCQRQVQRLVVTGTPLSLTAGPNLPLQPELSRMEGQPLPLQRPWRWPLSWALLRQRRAGAVQCARAF